MSDDDALTQGAAAPWTFPRIIALAATLGAMALALWLVTALAGVLLLFMLAVLFAVMLDAGVRGLRSLTYMPRGLALALLWAAFTAILVAAILLLAPRVTADIQALSERLPQALAEIDAAVEGTSWGRRAADELTALRESSTLRETAQNFLGFFSTLLGTVSGILVVLVLGVFLASEPDTYVSGAVGLLPPDARPRARQVAARMGHALRWWLLARFASMAVVFVFTWIGLAALGVPLAFMLALIAGLFSFVPTFGPVASAVPAILVGLSSGPQQAFSVALLYLGIQLVESYGITPFMQRRAVRLPPALLVVFQLIMGVLAGVLGVLLATPILVVLMVLAGMLYLEDGLGEGAPLP
ncbi:AI-2E family transporter [uncultured Thiohalocapsa sp.]|uniref:AI-2E family transporter n=1 Tax=uncultured Thiohalocapsa sp. TaxID=768990 RepID=UPI00260048F0|nr:AI-2E family transporter [uncultured Thiohalocapsa sp.]